MLVVFVGWSRMAFKVLSVCSRFFLGGLSQPRAPGHQVIFEEQIDQVTLALFTKHSNQQLACVAIVGSETDRHF